MKLTSNKGILCVFEVEEIPISGVTLPDPVIGDLNTKFMSYSEFSKGKILC